MRLMVCALLMWMAAATASAAQPQPAILPEARRFMEGYARDLAAGDRAGVAARYDRTGVFFLVGGHREFVTHQTLE